MKFNFEKNNLIVDIKKTSKPLINNYSRPFICRIPKERKFKIENLFEFKRTKGDLALSFIFLLVVMFLLIHFNHESGWYDRNLDHKRFGKILKQQWVGPLICICILLPSACINFYQSFKISIQKKKLRIKNLTFYEISEWIKSLEFIFYFLAYTFLISILGYLFSTLIFAVFLTYRLGYRTYRWVCVSLFSAFCIVVVFRTILQIKTPINIWLYDQFPETLEIFMKIYF